MRCIFILLFSISALIFAAGCSTAKGYPGPSAAPAQTAVLRAFGVTFHQVNGIEVGATATGIEVLSGKNEIRLTANASNFNNPETVTTLYTLVMNAEAGKEYAVTGKRGEDRLCAWEISRSTGQPDFDSPAGCVASQ